MHAKHVANFKNPTRQAMRNASVWLAVFGQHRHRELRQRLKNGDMFHSTVARDASAVTASHAN